MRSLFTLILSIALVGVLYLSNPTTEDFSQRYVDEINRDVAQELGLEGTLGNLLGSATQNLIAEALAQETNRNNYVVASVFSVPLSGEDLRVLGIAGQFFPLNQPEQSQQ